MKTEKKFFSHNGHTYIIVKGDKRWYIEYYQDCAAGVKKRKRVYGYLNRIKYLPEREKKALELINEIAANQYSRKEKKASPLMRILEDCGPDLRKKSFSTYKSKLKQFQKWLNGRSELKLTTQDANDFLHYLRLKNKHPTTVHSYKVCLHTLYHKLDVPFNPFKDTIVIKKQVTSKLYFTKDQVEALKTYLQKNDAEAWMAVQLLYYCFIRPAEIRLLKLSDINLQDGWIRIRAEISKNKKTQKVSIPRPLNLSLNQYIETRENKWELIISRDVSGKVPVAVNHLYNVHKTAQKACGIEGNYSFYSWKHTGAVAAVKAGINIKDLQLQLRHHSLDQVNEYLKDLGVMDSEDLKYRFPRL